MGRPRKCQGGAWGAPEACITHEGRPLGTDGRCDEGRPVRKARAAPRAPAATTPGPAVGRGGFWEKLDAVAEASRRRLEEETRAGVEAFTGWAYDGRDSAGRWWAHGPDGKRAHAASAPELVRAVQVKATGRPPPGTPEQGRLL